MAMTRTYLTNAVSRTVTSSSAKFTAPLVPGKTYRIVADVDFWYELDNDAATLVAAEDGAVFQPAGVPETFTVPSGSNTYLFVIRAAVDGTVCLAEVCDAEVC